MMRCTLIALLMTVAVLVPDRAARSAVADSALALPRVDILYPHAGSILDREIRFHDPAGGDSADFRKAAEMRPELQSRWNREGAAYLRAALALAGRPFPYQEVQVVLTVSPLTSMSTPLIVNVRRILPGAKDPAPPEDFVEKVFHELMHHYAAPVRTVSALMKKYSGESPVTLSHLHVMALEVMVLKQLGKTEELAYLDQLYRSERPSAEYARAWRIVNDLETPAAFIAELKRL